MRSLALITILALGLLGCSGAGPRNFEGGNVHPVVERSGDQIHPDLDGRWLTWFDLEDDPNGACHIPPYTSPQGYDDSCQGVVKSMDLSTGRVRTLSEVLNQETIPVVSEGLVAWRCWRQGTQGLCFTRADLKEVTFLPEVKGIYYYGQAHRVAIDRGLAAWVEYGDYYETAGYLVKRIELRTGHEGSSHQTGSYPSEVVVFGHRLAWVTTVWESDRTSHRLESLDTLTNVPSTLLDGDRPIFGLGGAGRLLAFKQGQADNGVHVLYLDLDGQIKRADSAEARVSANTPVSVAEDLLVWLDHREGDYRVVAYDLNGGGESILSPSQAMIGAYMPPAADRDQVVWADRRDGDWDLYLYKF